MRLVVVALVLTFLTGCSAVDMKQYSANDPRLDLYDYFSGSTRGWGIVQDRKGTLIRQFVVEIMGEITDGGQLVLTETFDWSDGEQSNRTWILSQQDQHSYTGTAEDVVGRADGILYGNVLNWQYQLNLVVDDTSWEVTFDDWMFKVSDDMLINRATMSKFGFEVGEITIVFRK
jgi:hypothetical protein